MVGTRSYGKGVFQQEIDLSNGGALKLTIGEYFTPTGSTWPATGSTPTCGRATCPGPVRDEGLRTRACRSWRPKRSEPARLALLPGAAALARAGGEAGAPKNARDAVEALLRERLGRRGFRAALETEAGRRPMRADERDAPRRDLTELPTFTVDPATARDFDDAVSARREGDGARIWVHIADVAAHVRPGSPLDLEAARRANSTYVPGAVEPMLPHALSRRPAAWRRASSASRSPRRSSWGRAGRRARRASTAA